jgi:pantoate kinase
LKHVLDVITERSGRAEAEAVIGETCSRSAIEQGKAMAEGLDHAPTLSDFADILPNWTKEDALQIETLVTEPDQMDFNVTRCRYAEMYKEMGLGDIGHLLSCNPDIQLERTQTIMKGASHCDFRYKMK